MDVVALGELLIDFTCLETDAGGYPVMAAHPGGAPANFLAALSRFGWKTALLGKVGADAFGDLLLGTLQQAGIDTRGMVQSADEFTTLAFVTLDRTGDRAFSFARKPGADTRLRAEEVKTELIDSAKVFHFGTLSLTDEPAATATRQAVEYARQRGKLISFDPNLRKPLWKDLNDAAKAMDWGLSKADIVKISDEEVEFLFGCTPEDGAKRIIEEYGAQLVFVTCGGQGSYFRNAKASGHVPGLSGLTVRDTTGAGDIFGGSALSRILALGKAPRELDGEELRQITRFACTVAGLSTTKPGGISSVPRWEEVRSRIPAVEKERIKL